MLQYFYLPTHCVMEGGSGGHAREDGNENFFTQQASTLMTGHRGSHVNCITEKEHGDSQAKPGLFMSDEHSEPKGGLSEPTVL